MTHPEKDFDKLEQRFFNEWVRRNPLLGTALGLHDPYDHLVPDGTKDKLLDDVKFLRRSLAEFEVFRGKKLPPARQIDCELAIHTLKLWIFDREEIRLWEVCPEAPHVVGLALFQLLYRNYAPLGERLRSIMKRLEKIPQYIREARTKLSGPVRQFIESELETLSRLPGFFNGLRDVSREQIPATTERALHRLIEDTQTALDEYENWIIVDIKHTYRDPWWIGDEKFRKLLALRGIDDTPGGLVNAAEAEMERLREKLREIGHQIKRKVVVEDVREIVRQQHPDTIDAVFRVARDAMQKAKQFTSRSKFAEMPDHDTLVISEMPTFLHHVMPWGGYFPPAKFEQKSDGYFFVTPGDCDSDKLKEHNFARVQNLAVHETYPGHHLQSLWSVRKGSLLRLLMAEAPETREGWATYCEERVKEMGFDDTPQARFQLTLDQILRAARVVMDVKLSTGKMGYQQAIEYLIDTVGMDRVAAEAEVRRYIVSPGYQLSYFWGKEKIKELKKWAKEKMRSRWNEAFFHTAVLQAGALPIRLLKQELDWRIEEELKKPVVKADAKHEKGKKGAKGPAKNNGAKLPEKPSAVKPADLKAAKRLAAAKPAPAPRRAANGQAKPVHRPKKAAARR